MLTGVLGTATAERTGSTSVSNTEESTESSDLGLDQVFEILKNQRRRYVLHYLRAVDEQVTLSDLSEQIAAWENDKDVRQITSSERKRVYVGLYQCHLPKMDGMDVVSFNKPRAIIEPGENIGVFYQYLDVPQQGIDQGWSKYYVGLSLATLVVLLGAVALEMTTAVPAVRFVAGLSPLAFATLAVLHYRSQNGGDVDAGTQDPTGFPTEASSR